MLLVTTPRARASLAPLLDVWAAAGPVHVESCSGRPPTGDQLAAMAAATGVRAVMVVGPRRCSPRTAIPGPVLPAANGRSVPVGWLPDVGIDPVRAFATAAATVHARRLAAGSDRTSGSSAGPGRTLAVLGQRHGRFDDLASRILRLVEEGLQRGDPHGVRLQGARWTAYDLHRDDLAGALALGPALAVYVGHGRPSGWVGYAGTRAHHLGADVTAGWQPSAVILSLTCRTASRYRTGLSFAEAIALRGATAAAVGAVRTTSHLANARWALRLTRAAGSAATVGDLVAAVAPYDPAAATYRLIGDPTAPLLDATTMAGRPELIEVA